MRAFTILLRAFSLASSNLIIETLTNKTIKKTDAQLESLSVPNGQIKPRVAFLPKILIVALKCFSYGTSYKLA